MASFEARYDGVCPAGDDIEPGDTVIHDTDDLLWHTACLREDEKNRVPVATGSVCQQCWLVEPCEHTEIARAAGAKR